MFLNLLKAAMYRPKDLNPARPLLPNNKAETTLHVCPEHCQHYHGLTQWNSGIAALMHPCYLQVLSLPMQLELMTSHPYPFKPIGSIHIGNSIKVMKLPEQNALLELTVKFGELLWHKRGWVVPIITEVNELGKTRVRATSFYLSKFEHVAQNNSENIGQHKYKKYKETINSLINNETYAPVKGNVNQVMMFPSNIGRKYASLSKDFNPIHLYSMSARLFGFKKAIAHGMHTCALCLSKLFASEQISNALLSESFIIETEFVKPIYLPSSANFKSNQNLGESSVHLFELSSNTENTKQIHLLGKLTFD